MMLVASGSADIRLSSSSEAGGCFCSWCILAGRPCHPKRFAIETNTPAINIATADGRSYPYLIATSRGKIFPLRGQMTVQATERSISNLGSEISWLLTHGKGFDYMTRHANSGDFWLGGGVFQGGNAGLDDIGGSADDKQNFLSICHLSSVLSRITRPAEDRTCHSEDAIPPTMRSSWTGIIALSCDMKPWVGKLPASISGRELNPPQSQSAGEWVAAGYSGSGMVYCWRSGQAIAAMIRDQEVGDWFPSCLLPTTERFNSMGAEEIAIHLPLAPCRSYANGLWRKMLDFLGILTSDRVAARSKSY